MKRNGVTLATLGRVLLFVLVGAAWVGEAQAVLKTSTGTGNWNTAGTWSPSGVPANNDDVVIASPHTVTLNVSSNRLNSVTVNLGGTLQSNNGGFTLTIGNGAGTPSPFMTNNGIINFSGAQAANIDLRATAQWGGSATSTWNLSTINLRNNDLTFAAGASFTMSLSGASNPFSSFGTVNTISTNSTVTFNYNGAAQSLQTASIVYPNLILSGSGTKTPSAGTMTVAGSFTLNSGVTYAGNTNNPGVNIAGDFSNSGTFTSGSGTYTFNGTTLQTLGGTAATTFTTLTINKPSNNVSIACGTPSPTVNTTLTLTSGRIITSGTSPACSTACSDQVPIIVAAAGTIAGGSSTSYVTGALRKLFSAGATLNFRATAGQDEFPVGDSSNYTPVEITAGTTSTAGNVTVCVTPTEHPQVTTPPVPTGAIDAAKSVNRNWSLTNSGLNTSAALVDATFKFVAGDVDAGAITSNFIIEDWNGTIWSPTSLVNPAATSTRAQNIDLTDTTNDIAIGEPLTGFTALPGQFNAFDTTTPAGSVLGMIQTKQTGVAFSVRLVRLNTAKSAIDTTYNQASVTVELLDSSDNTGALNTTTACRPIGAGAGQWHQIAGASQTVTFVNGVVNTVSFTVTNSYKDVRVHVVKTGAGAGEGCSTDRFAIRPQSLTITAHDLDWQSAGTTRALDNTGATGGNVHKASTPSATTPRPFTLRVTPVPAGATNYDGSPGTVSGFPACIAPPAGCTTGTLSYAAGSWTSAGSGVREYATAHYAEAGVFNLQLEDTGYASVDAVDGTPAATRTVPATGTAQIGRFVPDHFDVTTVTDPVFRTFNVIDTACSTPPSGPRRSFTYIGQFFGYGTQTVAMITARNAAGGTTTNYQGSLWKLAGASVTQTFANSPAMTLDTSQLLAPTVAETPGTGTGTMTANGNDKLAFARNNATPQAAFNANLSLTVSVSDASEAGASQGTITTAVPLVFNGGGSGIAFDGGGASSGKEFRYGRLRLGNANGSQLVPLQLPSQVQYWTGAPTNAFVTSVADHCTTLAGANIAMSNFQGSLGPLATCRTQLSSSITFTAGRGNLQLSAPGAANGGSVDLTVNLGASGSGQTCVIGVSPPAQSVGGADRAYLQGNWTGGAYDQNPSSRATFGVYKGSEEIIDIRETF